MAPGPYGTASGSEYRSTCWWPLVYIIKNKDKLGVWIRGYPDYPLKVTWHCSVLWTRSEAPLSVRSFRGLVSEGLAYLFVMMPHTSSSVLLPLPGIAVIRDFGPSYVPNVIEIRFHTFCVSNPVICCCWSYSYCCSVSYFLFRTPSTTIL